MARGAFPMTIATHAPARRHPRARRPTLAAALPLLAVVLPLAAPPLPGGFPKRPRRSSADETLARAIALVNNEKILYEDFVNQYQLFLTKWDRFIQNDPDKKQEIKELLLQRSIDDRLIDQEARRK